MENQPNISFNPNCRPTPDKGCCREPTPPFPYPNEFISRSQIHAICFHFFAFHLSFQFALIWKEWRHILWKWWWRQGPLKLCLVCFAKTVFSLPRLDKVDMDRGSLSQQEKGHLSTSKGSSTHFRFLQLNTTTQISNKLLFRKTCSYFYWEGGTLINVSIFSFLFLLQSLVRLVQLRKHECSVKIVLFLVHHSTRFRDPEV